VHVVILGARAETITALLSSGHRITVLYENNERNRARIAPYHDRLHGACVVDSYFKVESLWSALHHTGAAATGVDAVVPLFEDAVVPAAVLGELLDAKSIKPATALRCRDKSTQKLAWRAAGVPAAKHVVATGWPRNLAVLAAEAGLSAPFVVKPTAGFGTMQTVAVADPGELDPTAARLAEDHPELARLLIEERNPGDEWIIDGMVRGGRIRWVMLTRFCTPMIACSVARPVRLLTLSPVANAREYAYATSFAQRAVDALELSDSTFHLEVFGEPGAFVAGELAARPGGGMLPATMRRVLGVDVWACAAQVVTGDEPVAAVAPRTATVFGYCGLPITPGAINRVAESDLGSLPGVVEVEMNIATGVRMPTGRAHSGVQVAGVLVEGPDEGKCLAALDGAVQLVREINGDRLEEEGQRGVLPHP
jgi:biotin carboxylase